MGYRFRRRCREATVGVKMTVAQRFTLVQMGEHALDSPGKNPEDPVGVYWGGHGQLALEVYGTDTTTTRRRIRENIAALELLNLIRSAPSNPGYNRQYQLLPLNPDR
jgi:hypothetical protein